MKLSRCLAAGALALAGLLTHDSVATASPFSLAGPGNATGFTRSGNGLVQKVSGCHKYAQNHMVYLWGYPAWHSHGYNCQPQPANPPGYYPGYPYPGYGQPPGFVNPGYCHGNWQNHYHPGFGGGWHRHSSKNCQPRRGRQWRGGPKTGCINIGGIWICG